MNKQLKISFIVLCLLLAGVGLAEEEQQKDLDKGKTIFKKEKPKKIKVKPQKKTL